MKKCILVLFISFIAGGFARELAAQNRFWVASSASNWNNTANWSTTSGGAGGASVPGSTEVAIFNANGTGDCNLDIAPTVNGITVNGYTGTLDLQGNSLTTTGTNTLTTGTIANSGAAASLTLNTLLTTTFSGTLFNASITGTSGRLLFNGSTFNRSVDVSKTDSNTDNGTGNNVFNNTLTLNNNGTGELRLGTSNPDIFSTLTININSTAAISLARASAVNQFNENIIINYNAPGAVVFGAATGSSTLANGKTISIGTVGASGSGNLILNRFTQTSATAQVLTLSGNLTAILTIANASSFGGNLTLTAPGFSLSGSQYNGATSIEKTGQTDDTSAGGNTFQSSTTIINSGTGEIIFANTTPDVFNGHTTITNTNSGRVQIGINSAGNVFANGLTINHGGNTPGSINTIIGRNSSSTVTITGDVVLNNSNADPASGIVIANDGAVTINGNILVSSSNGRGVLFGSGTGTVTQTGGNISSGAFTAGNLSFSRFIQTSTSPNTITLAGSSLLAIANGSEFGGNVTFSAPQLTSNGTTFHGTTILEKTGATDNYSGGNIFEAPVTVTNSGSGEIFLGNGNADTFSDVATFNNTGSYRICIAYNHNGQTTQFNNNVTLNSNKSGGADSWSFLIGENTNSHVTFGGSLTINVGGSLRSDHRFLNGTGSIGTFNGPVTINETNTHASTVVTMGVNGIATYGENIIVNNPGGTYGVIFNSGAASGSTLATGKTITIGGGGFIAGVLSLQRFVQTDATDQILTTFSGTASLILGPASQFGGNVTFKAPRLFLNGVTVAGAAVLEKNGASDDSGTGGNVFQGVTTITHSGSGYLLTGNTNADQFGATTTINLTGSGRLHLAQNHGGQTTSFASDVTFNVNKTGAVDQWGILFCEGANTAVTFGGNLTILNAGSFRSDSRFLNGAGSSAVYTGTVTVNVTNTNSATVQNMGTNGQSTFKENIIVSNNGGADGVYFNSGATGSSTLAAGKTITLGASGFTSGTLSLPRFTQADATAQSLNPTGTTVLVIGPASQFDGNVNFVSPRLLLNGCTYGGTGNFEKTGASNDASSGGNIFAGATTITNSGTGYLLLGNGSRDQFLSAATFNNTGSYRIYFSHNHPGQTTEFLSSLTLNSNKTGGTDAWSYLMAEGANTFVTVAGTFTFNNGGTLQSNSRFLNGAGSAATYGGLVTINLTNTNSSTVIYLGDNGTSTYNGNISVSNTGGAAGINFNNGSASGSVLNGSISSGDFTSGQLNLYRFTQVGAIPQSLTLTTAGTLLRIGPGSSFDGDVTFVSPRLLLNGAVYNGTAYLEKNGTSDDGSNGGNIFNGTTTLVNSGSGYLLTAYSSPDIFNGDVTITNSGSHYIYLAYNVPGNEFNGNIILNNTGSALGIRFSHSATGAATFNAGTDKTISIGGSGFSVGELGLRRFTQTGTVAQTLTLTGSTAFLVVGPTSEFNGNVTFTSPRIFLYGCRYNGTAYLEKTGPSNDDGLGGNIFNSTATIANSGSAYLLTGSTNPDIFNGILTINNTGSSSVRLADNSPGNQFNENILLNSTSGGGIYFGNNVNGTSTLDSAKTIAVGSSGFITGDVRLIRFTQVGPTPQALNLGGIAILTLGPSSSFGGDVDFRSPQLYLNGTSFNGTSYLEKNGASNNYSTGGNTFTGSSTLVHSGSGYLAMALNLPDIFQSDLTATNTGSDIIYLANNVTGNEFNGNITFNSTLGSGGIYIGNNATGSATLGNGASLLTGGLGFSSGELRLKRLTQIGNSAQTLTLTGTALLRIGPASVFNGDLNFLAPQIALDGAVYNGVTYLEKTGAGNNDSAGGNSFLGTTTIANSGSGYFRFAVTTLDIFGTGDLILTNTGTSTIRMADNVPGTVFNGNIFVNSTFGGGIYFSESGGGTASLSAGKSIAVGGTGFTTGDLRIRRFTQSDAATPQTLLLTGTSSLVLGPAIAFSGTSDFRAPQVYMNGGIFNGTTLIEKTGATDNNGNGGMTFQSTTTLRLSGTGFFRTNGGNIFNGTTSIINTGSNYMLFELTTGSSYNGELTLTNSGSSNIRMAYAGTSSFNGNILVNGTSGTGIYFGESATGFSTLAAGGTIATGGTGFTTGELRLYRFTQTGATAQNIVLTGAATLRSGPTTTWNGNFTASSPGVLLDGTTFNGTTNSITKTGSTTDTSVGGNIFSAGTTTTLINSGTGVLRLANTATDDYIGNIIFNQIAGTIQPAYNVASTFRSDVTVTSTSAITFGAASGGITFAGTANQNVNKGGTASPVFRRLVMNKASGTTTLNTDATVSLTATFTSGILNTTAANYLNFADDATTTGANNLSFVDGPVRKTGNDAFIFPVGDNTFYRPAAISAPTGTAHYFIAQYVNADHGLGSVGDPSFTSISKCEYWTIDRNAAPTSNVLVTLSWQEAACVPGYITDPAGLRVARWNGTSWVNHGNGGTTGTATNGTVATSGTVTSFSPFTLASALLANPLPVELTSFKASITKSGTGLLEWHTESELNNDRFEIQRSVNGIDFTYLASVEGSGTTSRPNDYQFEDKDPILSLVYYRLKQVDLDGEFEYSNIVSLDYTSAEINPGQLMIFPNPINSGSFASFADETRATRQSVTIFNSVNQVVRQYSDVEGFSTEGLAPGIYMVKNKAGEIFRFVIK